MLILPVPALATQAGTFGTNVQVTTSIYSPFTPPLPKNRFEPSDIKEIDEDVVCASQTQRRWHRSQHHPGILPVHQIPPLNRQTSPPTSREVSCPTSRP